MDLTNATAGVTGFSKDAIRKQVAKIISDPLFEKSGILKNFLLFIVEETINGHANQLKEYTIALSILHKPLDFKPQENGILRIHAGRLRKALEQYYHSSGTTDAIHIFIPKGSYVPVFEPNTGTRLLTQSFPGTDSTTVKNMQKNLPLPLCHSAILTEVRSPILYRRYRAAVKCGVGRGGTLLGDCLLQHAENSRTVCRY